jgi:hypothetical protein
MAEKKDEKPTSNEDEERAIEAARLAAQNLNKDRKSNPPQS